MRKDFEQQLQNMAVFMPYASRRVRRLIDPKENLKLAYYTSADTALKIIENKEVWMRNARCINDFREVQHGIDYVQKFLEVEGNRKAFASEVDGCHPGASAEVLRIFGAWTDAVEFDTYITCLSEHHDQTERFGRLSMWRAYSQGSPGVAFVLNVDAFMDDNGALGINTTPVGYFENDEFGKEFQAVIQSITHHRNLLKQVPWETLIAELFRTLLFAAVAMKHPGFREEAEWRVVYFPKFWPSKVLSAHESIHCVNGIPQTIYRIPLDGAKGGTDFPRLLHKIIIGPSDHPDTIKQAFVSALEKAGIKDAATRVFASEIPLRWNK